MDQLKRDFSVLYICESCNDSTPPPTHCGRAMQLNEFAGKLSWVCWKGEHSPCCGTDSVFPIDNCCETPKLIPETPKILF